MPGSDEVEDVGKPANDLTIDRLVGLRICSASSRFLSSKFFEIFFRRNIFPHTGRREVVVVIKVETVQPSIECRSRKRFP